MELKGLTALVTGAGGGIGRAIALALADKGVNVVLFGGKSLEKLSATANAVRDRGVNCIAELCDLTDYTSMCSAFDKVKQLVVGIDVLVNNAGMAYNEPFENTPVEIFDKIMNINARAPYLLTQLVLPYLKSSKRASIINISSVVAHAGYPDQSAYSASKHALIGFTKSLAKEVYKDGIRVHAVSPGGVYTDMIKIARPDLTSEGMIIPKEIADIVMFLIENRGNAVIDEIIVHRAPKEPFLV